MNRDEPVPDVPGSFEPPDRLTESQKAIWREVIEQSPLGLLRGLDLKLVELWTVNDDIRRRAAARLNIEDLVVERGPGQTPIPNRHFAIMNKADLMLARLADALGFSPSSRTRVAVARSSEVSEPVSGATSHAQRKPVSLEQFLASAPPVPSFPQRRGSRRQ